MAQGFTPQEFTGFEGDKSARWQITETAQNAGGFGVRPGILKANESAQWESRHRQLA